MNFFLKNKAFETLKNTLEPDFLLQQAMKGVLSLSAAQRVWQSEKEKEVWTPGKPLKLLLAGYVGSRNTGADVRTEEIIRQLRHLLGDEHLELTIMTLNPERTAGYFRAVRQIEIPLVFPQFLREVCPRAHGVVACEGSMFKSKFSNALTLMMAGALGMANLEGKLSVGYGAEAGSMDRNIQEFVQQYVQKSLILCRNTASQTILKALGIRAKAGTDTAWTFQASPREYALQQLRHWGWDGEQPLLAICPIHPFCWPVKPDVLKSLAFQFTGEFKNEHYRSLYFHHHSTESEQKFDDYLNAFAGAIQAFLKETPCFPLLIGMEALDRTACERLQSLLDPQIPLLVSDTYDMYDLVAFLRCSHLMITSRYHAFVTSIPAQVPTLGVTMDERIANIMEEGQLSAYCLSVEDPQLEEKILQGLRQLHQEKAGIQTQLQTLFLGQLQRMGQMGIEFLDELSRVYPEFPRKDRPLTWESHLPPLPQELLLRLEKMV
jgi:polysaccharide pyruvyl transferase WcaK-like protein